MALQLSFEIFIILFYFIIFVIVRAHAMMMLRIKLACRGSLVRPFTSVGEMLK